MHICYTEARNIRRCLDSLEWVDEIVIVDSMSSHDTVDIARQYTGSIFQRSWTGYVDQVGDVYLTQQGLDFGIED